MQCDDVGAQLASVVDGSSSLDRRAAKHAAGCLRCQAELAHYRRLRRTLRQLAYEPVAVPAGLADSVIAHLDRAAESLAGRAAQSGRPWARRAAYAGAVAATAAGAAGAIALVSSRRRGRAALGALAAVGA